MARPGRRTSDRHPRTARLRAPRPSDVVRPRRGQAEQVWALGTGTGVLAPFASKGFRRYWFAAVLSNTGSWMQLVTVPYVIDQMTRSTAWVGLAAFCTLFPAAAVSPLAGAWTDRYSRRLVFGYAQVAMVVATAALLTLWATGVAAPWSILVCVIASAVGNGVMNVSQSPYASELVPPDQLVGAIRLGFTQSYAARATGPAVAGVLLATTGPSAAFAANIASFLPLMYIVATAPTRELAHREGGRAWKQFREGVSYIWTRRGLRLGALLMFGLGMFGMSMVQLLEPLARHVYQRSAGDYGLLVTCYGFGAMVGAFASLALDERITRSRAALLGLAGAGACFSLCGIGSFAVALPAVIVFGFTSVTAVMAVLTSCQANTADMFRGRLTGLLNVVFNGAIPLGALIGGVLGELLGLRAVLVGDGLVGLVLLAVLVRTYEGLTPLDQDIVSELVA